MKPNLNLSKEAINTILEIEKQFNEIKQEQNTSNALDFLQEIIEYLRATYFVF